jgi:acyl-CoA-binding protein
MEKKKQYETNGVWANIQSRIKRNIWMKAKAIMTIKGQTKEDALTEAVDLYNEKHKEVLS